MGNKALTALGLAGLVATNMGGCEAMNSGKGELPVVMFGVLSGVAAPHQSDPRTAMSLDAASRSITPIAAASLQKGTTVIVNQGNTYTQSAPESPFPLLIYNQWVDSNPKDGFAQLSELQGLGRRVFTVGEPINILAQDLRPRSIEVKIKGEVQKVGYKERNVLEILNPSGSVRSSNIWEAEAGNKTWKGIAIDPTEITPGTYTCVRRIDGAIVAQESFTVRDK